MTAGDIAATPGSLGEVRYLQGITKGLLLVFSKRTELRYDNHNTNES